MICVCNVGNRPRHLSLCRDAGDDTERVPNQASLDGGVWYGIVRVWDLALQSTKVVLPVIHRDDTTCRATPSLNPQEGRWFPSLHYV